MATVEEGFAQSKQKQYSNFTKLVFRVTLAHAVVLVLLALLLL